MRVTSGVSVHLDEATAFEFLAAVHEARRRLQGAEPTALLDALASLERELGLAIGAAPARAFLERRARRRRASGG